MRDKRKLLYQHRSFLNANKTMTGVIQSRVSVGASSYDKGHYFIHGEMTIGSCYKIIELDISTDNDVKKLDKLIKVLTESRQALVEALAYVEKATKESKVAKKGSKK